MTLCQNSVRAWLGMVSPDVIQSFITDSLVLVLDSPRKQLLFGVTIVWWLERDSCRTLVSIWSPSPCNFWSFPSGFSGKIDNLHSNSGLQQKKYSNIPKKSGKAFYITAWEISVTCATSFWYYRLAHIQCEKGLIKCTGRHDPLWAYFGNKLQQWIIVAPPGVFLRICG